MTRLLYTFLLLVIFQIASVAPQDSSRAATSAEDTAEAHHRRGFEFHSRRCLNDASSEYARALELDPPRELSVDEWKIVRRFAPRVYTTPSEPFPLKDFAVIVHPTERLIAYHFFWDDDIDFPEDNDPCDHELIWVKYSVDKISIESVMTYYHGRILEGGQTAINDARAHGMRPRVNVQWGKHGSLLVGWEEMTVNVNPDESEKRYYPTNNTITIKQDQQSTYRRLNEAGHRLLNHPISQRLGWPQKFKGSWEEFVNFSRLIDPLESLDKTKMARVTRWNNATINQYFLAYNFRPKTEWPIEKPRTAAANSRLEINARAMEDFQLPPKSVFDKAMPRYPNVWFYVDASLASAPEAAVKLVTENLRAAMRLRESYGPFSNPEGCDFEAGLEHLQPWEMREQRPLQHSHAFHIRYYYSALTKQKLDQVKLKTDAGERAFYRFGASAHYEVEHTNPNHADVESCPICGRMGEYRDLKGNLVELVHDPLGLELLQSGKVRGESVRFEDWERREVGGVEALKDKFSIQQFTFAAQSGDKNTLRIGVIVIAAK
jgi:hypothetical protein